MVTEMMVLMLLRTDLQLSSGYVYQISGFIDMEMLS